MPTQAEAAQAALIKAAHFSDLVTLTRLVKKGVHIDATDECGYTALIMTACNRLATNELDCLNLLIANGANVDAQTEFKSTALHCACLTGQASMIESLLKAGADASIKDENGRTALDLAERGYHTECIKLMENPPDVAAQAAKKAPENQKAKKQSAAAKKTIAKKPAAAKTIRVKQLAKKKPAVSKTKS
jgi:ankyrin repeat protein